MRPATLEQAISRMMPTAHIRRERGSEKPTRARMRPVCALTIVICGSSPGVERVRAGAPAGDGGAARDCGPFAREDVISALREVAAFALAGAPPPRAARAGAGSGPGPEMDTCERTGPGAGEGARGPSAPAPRSKSGTAP